MKKISILSLAILVIAIPAGIASLFIQKDSILYSVCDIVSTIGILTYFALGAIMCAIAFKAVREIPDGLQRKVMTTLIVCTGSFAFAASFGTGILIAIVKYQGLTNVHSLPWYGKISGLMWMVGGVAMYFIAVKATKKIPFVG